METFFARTIGFSGMSNLNMLSNFFSLSKWRCHCKQMSTKINPNWNKLVHNLGPMQTTFGTCVQVTCLGSFILFIYRGHSHDNKILQKKSKNCTDFSYVEKYRSLWFIKVTLLMLNNSKNQCKKLISLKHSVRATQVTPLKQQKSLCLTLWCAKLQMCP